MGISHKNIWSGLDFIAEKNNLTPSALAVLSGLSPTSFNKSKRFDKSGKARWPSAFTIYKVLKTTNMKFSDFAIIVENLP